MQRQPWPCLMFLHCLSLLQCPKEIRLIQRRSLLQTVVCEQALVRPGAARIYSWHAQTRCAGCCPHACCPSVKLRTLHRTRLCGRAGTLPCDLAPPGSVLARLDASQNQLRGTLPACLLAAPMAALALGGNRMTGWLPAPPSGCVLESLRVYGQVSSCSLCRTTDR